MIEAKDTGYLFAKMSSEENGVSHIVVIDQNGAKSRIPSPTRTYSFDQNGNTVKQQTFSKWLLENIMLLVTLIGVITGVVTGLSLRQFDLCKDTILLISFPGELFMRILKLMILPLVIASLITGSASINAKMNGKIALRTFVYFAITSMFNALLGVLLALLIHPGDPELHSDAETSTGSNSLSLMDSMLDLGRNIFPDNIFQAAFQSAYTNYAPKALPFGMNSTSDGAYVSEITNERVIGYRAGTNTLGIVVFCLTFGTILGTIGEKGQVVVNFFAAIFEVVMKMVILTCLWISPIGISSVIAGKILDVEDLNLIISQLLMFIITVASGVFFYQFIVLQLIYLCILKKNPFKFYSELVQPMLYSFATASKAAALPLTFQVLEQKVKVDKRITRFVLPIGIMNMDGTAVFIATSAIFIAQMAGMKLGVGEIVTVVLTTFAASLSSAPIPSAALVLLIMVLTAIDAPLQDVTLLFAIDWFVDRIRTTNNMLGDCYCAVVVEHLSRKELMACDAMNLCQDTSSGRVFSTPELVVVSMEESQKQDKRLK